MVSWAIEFCWFEGFSGGLGCVGSEIQSPGYLQLSVMLEHPGKKFEGIRGFGMQGRASHS